MVSFLDVHLYVCIMIGRFDAYMCRCSLPHFFLSNSNQDYLRQGRLHVQFPVSAGLHHRHRYWATAWVSTSDTVAGELIQHVHPCFQTLL